jgi:hypothetical protein
VWERLGVLGMFGVLGYGYNGILHPRPLSKRKDARNLVHLNPCRFDTFRDEICSNARSFVDKFIPPPKMEKMCIKTIYDSLTVLVWHLKMYISV